MGDIIAGRELGAIDLNHVITPIIKCIKEYPECLLRGSKEKIYVVTDEVIRRIVENKNVVEEMRGEGRLFSNIKYADATATWPRSDKASVNQAKGITEMEDEIYELLRSEVKDKESEFFAQSASSYFDALRSLSTKQADTNSQQSSLFPDARLLRKYPGTKARLRVPYHTIQMSGEISAAIVNAVKQIMRKRLSDELPEDEVNHIIETWKNGLGENHSRLKTFLDVLDRDAYGRIRRTYACSVLVKMTEHLPETSPAIPYARRVSDFNELVQGTLPETGLAADELVLEFPNSHGRGTMEFDLMAEFLYADSLNSLPFWISFNELISEESIRDSVTTTIGQHFKLNGKVQTQGVGSVFEFHAAKLETLAKDIQTAIANGKMPPDERAVCKVLRIAVMYYIVFRDDPGKYRNALTNYKAFRKAIKKWTDDGVSLDEILRRIAKQLKMAMPLNKQIRNDFKTLLESRRLDDLPVNKEKLCFIISRGVISKTSEMEDGEPIRQPPSEDHVTSYLRYLKITRHPGDDDNALVKEEIRFTESLRYLMIPETDEREREMGRDMNRSVLGVLFTPKDNNMLRLSLPFNGLTRLVISYERKQLHGTDTYLTALAQLIHVLLVYGTLKAVIRMADDTKAHGDKTMLLMLSLFSTSPQNEKSFTQTYGNGKKRGFTHDAHKAVEHIIRQHMPVKSQGFRLTKSSQWDNLIRSGRLKQRYPNIREAAKAHIKGELNDFRFSNIVSGLSSGMDALWCLPHAPSIEKIALLSVTSRSCDRLRKRSEEDRSVMFGHIHRFEYEATDEENGEILHFYRHRPVQAFCDEMETANCFKNPSVLFNTIRNLYEEGFRDVIIVTKVPFTRRIRMTTDEDSTYTNPTILKALNKEMPGVRVYPLFTQKSYGVRLSKSKTAVPIFLPPDAENDITISDDSGRSTLFRAGSVVTSRVVEGGNAGEKLHCGITDYLFRYYPDTVTIQSEAMSALTTQGKDQVCLHEVLRFLHSDAYEKSVFKKAGDKKPLEAKLDALDDIIGEESVGQQANILQFPKPKTKRRADDQTYTFSVNIIALLKHLENQSDLYRDTR